jgi:predicted nucleic acid-binding protein
MNSLFVDTGAWYALVDNRDPAHDKAKVCFSENRMPMTTTNFVFDETITLIRKKLGWQTASGFGEMLRSSERLSIIPVIVEDEQKAWSIFLKYRDQDFSYTDCSSFAVMQRLNIGTVFSFDHHFSVMKFNVVPD